MANTTFYYGSSYSSSQIKSISVGGSAISSGHYITHNDPIKLSNISFSLNDSYANWSGNVYWSRTNKGTTYWICTFLNGTITARATDTTTNQINATGNPAYFATITAAKLMVNFANATLLNRIQFSNDQIAEKGSTNVGSIYYTSDVSFSAATRAAAYSSKVGILYWGTTSGAKTYAFAQLNSNGSISIYSSHEPVTYKGERTIYITFEETPIHTLNIYFGDAINIIKFTNNDIVTSNPLQTYTTYNYQEDVTFHKTTPINSFTQAYMQFNGTVYWGTKSGAKTYTIGKFSSGKLTEIGTTSDRNISYTSDETRNIYLTADGYTLYELYMDPNGGLIENHTVKYTISLSWKSTDQYTLPSSGTKLGYKLIGFRRNDSTIGDIITPGSTVTIYSNTTFYAIWEKKNIAKFWWDGAEGNEDGTIISKGLACTKLTGANWTRFKQKIEELSKLEDKIYTATTTKRGDLISASEYNEVRSAIDNLKDPGDLPIAATSGKTLIKASYFRTINGSAALRDALNTAIENYNKS